MYDKPAWAAYYLLLVKVQVGKEVKAIEQFEAMGMKVILVLVIVNLDIEFLILKIWYFVVKNRFIYRT